MSDRHHLPHRMSAIKERGTIMGGLPALASGPRLHAGPDVSSSSYRPEIDGLRAVAVLAVLFYHAQLGMPGGFVGVDVFFVISGYLITSLLLKEAARGDLDLGAFWERRIRRLFPALAVVTFATAIAGWFLYLPGDYRELGLSISAQSVLSSNIFFWMHTNYFDGAADAKPLLHTWSLAVEEQFYLCFPLCLIGLKRLPRRVAAIGVAAFFLGAFALSAAGAIRHPQAAFYLLPFRAWELGLGALVALRAKRFEAPRWAWEVCSGGALAAIGTAMATYDSATIFPGFGALLPCAGTAAFIFSNSGEITMAGRLLAWRPIVFVGLVSYSLYLWHWPVLVFANYWALEPLGILPRLGLLGLGFVLAVMSWRYVETPFRRKVWFGSRAGIWRFALVSTVILTSTGLLIGGLGGFRSRLPEAVARYDEVRSEAGLHRELSVREAQEGNFVRLGLHQPGARPQLFVWGDSHAMSVLPALDKLCTQHSVGAVAAVHSMNPPLLGTIRAPGVWREAPQFNEAALGFIRTHHIQRVLLVAMWHVYQEDREKLREAFEKTVAALQNAGVRVWVMQDVPRFPWDVPKALARSALFGGDPGKLELPFSDYHAQVRAQQLDFLMSGVRGVTLLDPTGYLARGNAIPAVLDGVPNYRDDDHLSVQGAMLLMPLFSPLLSD